MNSSTQPAKMPGLSSGSVTRFNVVNHDAPAMRELWSSSSEIASIMEEMTSLESLFTLTAYFALLWVFFYLWPDGWNAWKESVVFWPTQGLIILAVIGIFGLRKWYTSLFFFIFFLSIAGVLIVASLFRDPRINPPPVVEKDSPATIIETPVYTPPSVPTFTTVEQEIPEQLLEESIVYTSPKQERKPLEKHANSDSTWWWVLAPVGNYGEITVPEPGYSYTYWPEALVFYKYNLNYPNRTSPPVPVAPGDKFAIEWKPVAWSSQGYESTWVLVVQKINPQSSRWR